MPRFRVKGLGFREFRVHKGLEFRVFWFRDSVSGLCFGRGSGVYIGSEFSQGLGLDCFGVHDLLAGSFLFFLGLGVLEGVSGFGFHSRLLSFRVGVVGCRGLGWSFGSERGG